MVEYFILTILLYRALRSTGVESNKALIYCLIFVVFYGLSDEFHQGFTPGREPKLRDVGFDTIGSLIANLFIWKLLPKAPRKLKSLAENFQLI